MVTHGKQSGAGALHVADVPPKRLIVLGSAGSIGESTLRVAKQLPQYFSIAGLAVDRNVDRVLEQAVQFGVDTVAVCDPAAARKCAALAPRGLRVLQGEAGVVEVAGMPDVDMVVAAIVGMAGLRPTLSAIEAGTDIALATKEVLVSAGGVVTAACERTGSRLLPIDSEPNAIFQCLAGKPAGGARRLILTASGGPFAGRPDLSFESVTVEQALAHPRWSMGKKVTIDSATLMNKGLEIMEASWLFGMPLTSIDVVIHPESVVHSMVEFMDGSVMAQMSLPDMRFAIQYALTHPYRLEGGLPALPLTALGALHFGEPDVDRFPCLRLARQAGGCGGSMPAVLNAANEIAVGKFLRKEIAFAGIWGLVERVMAAHDVVRDPTLDDILAADAWARIAAERSV